MSQLGDSAPSSVVEVRGNSVKAYFYSAAVIALVCLFAFSAWTQWGPYGWLLHLEIKLFGTYSEQITLIVMLVLFVIPGYLLWDRMDAEKLRGPKILTIAIPGALTVSHFGLVCYFIITGGAAPVDMSLDAAIKGATFIPKSVNIPSEEMAMAPIDQGFKLNTTRTGPDAAILAFARESWPDANTPVLLQSTESKLNDESKFEQPRIKAVVCRGPIPIFVREGLTDSGSMGIIVQVGGSVRDAYALPAIGYGAVLFLFLKERWDNRKKKRVTSTSGT